MKNAKLEDLLGNPAGYDVAVISQRIRSRMTKEYRGGIGNFEAAWAKRFPGRGEAEATEAEQLATDCSSATAGTLHAEAIRDYLDILKNFSACYDNQLVDLSKRGPWERALVLGLFQKVVASLYKASKRAKSYCPDDLDRLDLHREAFMTLLGKLEEENIYFQSGVKPYFEDIFIKKCMNAYSKKKRHLQHETDIARAIIDMMSGHGVEFNPEKRLFLAEAIEIIKSVDEECYQVLSLATSKGMGYSYLELAPLFNRSEAGMRTFARRCRTDLFNRVQELKTHYHND